MTDQRLEMRAAIGLGAVGLALLLGALGFQYLGGFPPCEMCHWQRWPHIAAAVAGLGGGGLIAAGVLPARLGLGLALMAALLVALSGVIGVYHAGVEWKWWEGPASCAGTAFSLDGSLEDALAGARIVRCDEAPWRLAGLSLAGYNALFSLGAAALGIFVLTRRKTP